MSNRRSDSPQSQADNHSAADLAALPGPISLDGDRQTRWASVMEMIKAYHASPDFKPIADGESVDRIRALRDEWD
ncbi:hypothetical protein [Aureimonas sp. Leaf454]|uniref:hypothetical protein n=1 Tax=Aureimonas sp. Leaf454 TaxID=1736381 RepID=UPI000A457C4D|nr:hypothetical protein [Aureimonas sp. Leaf454]